MVSNISTNHFGEQWTGIALTARGNWKAASTHRKAAEGTHFGGQSAVVEDEEDDGRSERLVQRDDVDHRVQDEQPAVAFIGQRLQSQHRRRRLLVAGVPNKKKNDSLFTSDVR